MADQEIGIGSDFLSQVLRGAKDRKIEMLEETYQEALRLAAEAGWSEEEALLGVFASGVAYLRNQLTLTGAAREGADQAATLDELAQRCMQFESMYSVPSSAPTVWPGTAKS